MAQTPKINNNKSNNTKTNPVPAAEHRTPTRTLPAQQPPPQVPAPSSNRTGGPTPSVLNPLAHAFVPFSVLLPSLDSSSQTSADPDSTLGSEGHDNKADDMLNNEALWENFCDSDDTAKPPPSCGCHDLPRGACPTIKTEYVQHISENLHSFGLTPNMDGLKKPLRNPAFSVPAWREALGKYFDGPEILKHFQYGWDISFLEEPFPKDALWNLQGASLYEKDVQHYIDQEVSFGALLGPFDDSELPFRVYCSPFNTVKKKRSEIRRTVVDCTQLDRGINSFVDAHLHRGKVWKLTLPNSQTIINLIQRARNQYPGQRILIWKLDFARWYRWILLDPVAAIYFAVRWRGKVYLDAAMSFGNRAAALAAQRIIWSVVHTFRTKVPPFPGTFNKGISCSCEDHCDCGENLAAGYIDDFLGFSPQNLAEIQFESALSLAATLGLRLSQTPGHISPPNAECECLGILYNTDDNSMRLPDDKVLDFTEMLDLWISKERATEHELSVLCGKILYAANVFFAGRLFLNRCLATKRFASQFKEPIYLDEGFRDDIRWWQEAIRVRNGVSFLVPESTIHVSLDASSNGLENDAPGLGGYNHSNHEYFSCSVPDELLHLQIADLELIAHVVAIHLWQAEWAEHQVTIHTDNEPCYYLLTNGRSREEIRLQMSRWIAMQQIQTGFRSSSAWIPTKENNLADSLSRFADPKQRRKFEQYCSTLSGAPTRRHVMPEMFEYKF